MPESWMRFVPGCLVCCAAFAPAQPPRAPSTQLTPPAVRGWRQAVRVLRGELNTQGVVGGAFMLLHRDRDLDHGVHGHADLNPRRKVDAQTIFHWASVTKTMTAIALQQLAQRGKLGLDDRIVTRIPALRKIHQGEFDLDAVTLRVLLQHAGGFRENTFPWGDQPWHPYEPADWSQLAAMFPYTRLHFAPGTRYGYSNPGFVLLGRTIELVAGEDYEVYVDKNILKPLGMHRSFFDNTPYHLLPYRSNSFRFRDGAFVAQGLDLDTGVTVSNGGLNAPLPDIARYLRFLLGITGEESTPPLLDAATLDAMWQPAQAAGKQGKATRSMGSGFFIYDLDGVRSIGHTGSQRGYQCFVLITPDREAAVLAAFNSESRSPRPEHATRQIMFRFMNACLETVLPRFPLRRRPRSTDRKEF